MRSRDICCLAVALVALLVAAPAGARIDRAAATSRAVIDDAYRSGEIDHSRMILLKAYALFAPSKLPEAYRGGRIDKCGVPMIDEIDGALPDLPPDVAAEIRGLRDRPVLTDYVDTEHFRIHYNTTGTHKILGWPDTTYRDAIETAAELSWSEEVDGLGFSPPPSDGSDPDGGGGNGLYDIYVQNLSGVYGYTEYSYNVPSTPQTDATSFVVIDNDYAGFGYPDPQDPMKVTVAHEFNHACQAAYDYTEGVWYKECSSVYMEDYVYDSINDYRQYISFFFNSPYRCLEYSSDPSGLRIYGSCVWNFYLAENFGPELLVENWEECEGSLSTTDEIDVVLGRHGSSMADAFAGFARWNFFTGLRDDGNHYDEGYAWGSPAVTATYNSYPVVDGAPNATYRPDHYGANYINLANLGSTATGLDIAYDGPQPGSTPSSAYTCYRKTDTSTGEYGGISLNLMGNGSITVEGWDEMSYVYLIVCNLTDNVDDMSYTFDADEVETGIGETAVLALHPASPNPFRESTSIAYSVPNSGGHVDIRIYDVAGREVRTLVSEDMAAGSGVAVWDGLDNEGRSVATGVYFARLDVDGLTASGKLMALK
jgi:hypothetical protein